MKKKNIYLKTKKFFFFKKKNLSFKKKKHIEEKNKQAKYLHLYKNKKLKKAIFLKKPKFNEIVYPFFLNMKLINEYLKKK